MTDKSTTDIGREALEAYLKDCEANAIVPDVGGAWHAAFLAGAASRTQPQAGVSRAADELARDLKHAIDTATELRQQLRLMEESARGEIWRWQADGVDNLATMGNRMGVLIYASDLRNLIASASAKAQAARAGAADTKTHELLSTTVGLLMGYREGGARQPYKPGSMIAKVVDEVVDHLKDWPHPEPTSTAQAAPAGAAPSLKRPVQLVYLVATGETRNGMELYERHDKMVHMADVEVLYKTPELDGDAAPPQATIDAVDAKTESKLAMADEYQRWIDYFHKGGGYDDFLRTELAAQRGGA